MPTLTPSDALIRAADNLTDAIVGIIPPPNITTDAINKLTNIFKLQAKKDKDAATAKGVLKEPAQAERVCNEIKDQSPTTKTTTTTVITPMLFPHSRLSTPTLTQAYYEEPQLYHKTRGATTPHQPPTLASSRKYKLARRIISSI
jgi:hypothetical protein